MLQQLKLWLHNVACKNRLPIGQSVTLAGWLADVGLFQAAKGLSRSEYGKYLLKLLEAGK